MSSRFDVLFAISLVAATASTAMAAPIVPGTGNRAYLIDDYEDAEWAYVPSSPKASYEQDKQQRNPSGRSKNGQAYESLLRGQPDVVERVETPEGGISGSTGALLMRSLHTGVPGRTSGEDQQDDLILNVGSKVGGTMPVSWTPSCTVRVYVPPFDQWEKRRGTSFGFRADVRGSKPDKKGKTKSEEYWPGFFIQFNPADSRNPEPSAIFLIRGNERGHEVAGPKITQPGWWTLGMSFSSDGQVHFYAREGVGDLESANRICSYYCYGLRAERFNSVFFNISNRDNGRNWSTPWIIDDPMVFFRR